MTSVEFRDALQALGLTQADAAKALGKSERTVRRYATDKQPVPEAIRLALKTLVSEAAQ